MSFAFKRFSFFNHSELGVHAYPKTATCYAPTPGIPGAPSCCVAVGCENGTAQLLSDSFQPLLSFQAHGYRVFELVYVQPHGLLVSCGSEEPGVSTATVKVWDLAKLLSSQGGAAGGGLSPQPLRLVKLFSSKFPEAEVTCMTAAELAAAGVPGVSPAAASVMAVAVGLATGSVYFMTLDLPTQPGLTTGGPTGRAGAGVPPTSGSAGASGKLGAGDSGSAPAPAPPPSSTSSSGLTTASKPITHVRLSARPEAGDHWAVTGLALQGEQYSCLVLFTVTESQTLVFSVQSGHKAILDQQGTKAPGCTAVRGPGARGGGTLMVARDEGLYDYTSDTRAGCTVFEGSKVHLALLPRYVVVVNQEMSEMGSSSATVHVADLRHKLIAGSLTLASVVAVIPMTPTSPAALPGSTGSGGTRGGREVNPASQAQQVAVVTGSGKVFVLKEIELALQLEALYKRSLHKLALDLARACVADAATIASIQQRWGDALYAKGEYDAAMVQYSETLGHLEPSYVIRRFLDAQRIHNLTSYLELLHDQGLASADHTTLLLNCYTKLKDVNKLDEFVQRSGAVAIHSDDHFGGGGSGSAGAGPSLAQAGPQQESSARDVAGAPGATGPSSMLSMSALWAGRKSRKAAKHQLGGSGDISSTVAGSEHGTGRHAAAGAPEGVATSQPALKFDAETAVRVLRGAGYARHALWVAESAGEPDWVLDILLEDCGAWDEALTFLDTLPRAKCAAALRRVGKSLVGARPEATTRLLMELCVPGEDLDGSSYTASVADFAHLFTDTPTALMLLCEFVLNTAPPGTIANEALLLHTLLELYLTDNLTDRKQQAGSSSSSGGDQANSSSAPSAAGTGSGPGSVHGAAPGPSAHDTAIPTVPGPPSEAGTQVLADKLARRGRALELLQSGWPPHLEKPKYDADTALVLCRLSSFKEGLVLLYDRLRLHREVLQVYMEARDHAGLIAAVARYGDESRGGDPQLWAEVLQYFVSLPPNDECEAQIAQVVSAIEVGRVLPPLVVLQLLAKNESLKVSTQVRGYVSRALAREAADAASNREQVAKLASETAALKAEVTRLKTQPHVFQASRCAATGQPLELPALHFLCGHSFNARSLGENDRECPLCAPDFRRVMEIRRSMAVAGLQQDRFFTELRESSDPFSTIAEHYGRGLMNLTSAAMAGAGAGLAAVAAAAAGNGSAGL